MVELRPPFNIDLLAVNLQRDQVTPVVFAGKCREPALVFQVPDKSVDPVSLTFDHNAVLLVALYGSCNQFAQASQKIDTHSRMKMIRVNAANGKEADF